MEALRRITGGVIRTIVILFEIFVDDTNGNAFLDLEKILDAVTPLYKHRMDKLSAQKQEIVDFIALSWDAVSAREIAKKTKLKSKAVSAQLKQLVKDQIIEKEKTNTKNYLYRISERFFNIWYLMCLGRTWDEKRVQFLVDFLQIWCDEEELENRAKKHLRTIKEDANAMNSLAWLYFQQKTHKNKALGFAEQAYKGENDVFNSHTYSMVLLWDNDIEKAYRVAQDFLTNAESFEEFPEDVSLFLMLLVAKKQYHLALKIFNENPHKLKDRFKPIYYALMYFMQDEYPNEYRKMGGELNQTVQEIIEKIHRLEEQYK